MSCDISGCLAPFRAQLLQPRTPLDNHFNMEDLTSVSTYYNVIHLRIKITANPHPSLRRDNSELLVV